MKNMIPLLNQELQRILSDSCYFLLELNINEKNELEFFLLHSAKCFNNLKVLKMNDNKIVDYSAKYIENLKHISELEIIDFSYNDCKRIAEFVSEGIDMFPKL